MQQIIYSTKYQMFNVQFQLVSQMTRSPYDSEHTTQGITAQNDKLIIDA